MYFYDLMQKHQCTWKIKGVLWKIKYNMDFFKLIFMQVL